MKTDKTEVREVSLSEQLSTARGVLLVLRDTMIGAVNETMPSRKIRDICCVSNAMFHAIKNIKLYNVDRLYPITIENKDTEK